MRPPVPDLALAVSVCLLLLRAPAGRTGVLCLRRFRIDSGLASPVASRHAHVLCVRVEVGSFRLHLLQVLRLFFCFVYLLLIALADVGLGERDFSPLPSRTESWLVWTIISHHDKTALDYLFPECLALHNCCSSMPMLIQSVRQGPYFSTYPLHYCCSAANIVQCKRKVHISQNERIP